MRERLEELPRERAIYSYCRSGLRSYLTYRLLAKVLDEPLLFKDYDFTHTDVMAYSGGTQE